MKKKYISKKRDVELKKRYKMYKVKKNWVVVPILFLGLVSNNLMVTADDNKSIILEDKTINESNKNTDIDYMKNKQKEQNLTKKYKISKETESQKAATEQDKQNAKEAIDQALAEKVKAIEGVEGATDADKAAAKAMANQAAEAAKKAIDEGKTKGEVEAAKEQGIHGLPKTGEVKSNVSVWLG
ncbi:DUF1542 domain-containing protein [Enterococcus hirae]|uniref:DUF1542 domain-containing protein n=2 Tax=Enterococcus hirae TaxID=1354 RepID=UPI001094A91A|nr:DUF1542 domain-containing protein [Enterococcus hirae]EMF0040485.1 KxYKxGKxW signal peptide domain-containing protein [Enterococcus hirae]MBO1091803.1 DUF1542 domain-containing protein [Enterococcus hirae]MCR1911234.1 DUF1542 domain-containing protein [Enterococcus hirae]MDL4887236.1 DUF1542 domain-containing protein [Enterococcus hirae]MDL4890276.1 DUF1542 domain-containing protein [Enterococcus hirae]